MKSSKLKIWLNAFFKTFVWLIIPLCIFTYQKSYESYERYGKYLTPFSVTVREYYRQDGTRVRKHRRRPPGGAQHDKPYESKRHRLKLRMYFITFVGLSSVVIFLIKVDSDIREFNLISDLQKRNEAQRKREQFVLLTVKNSGLNFNIDVPSNITKSRSAKCKFCKKRNYNDFYIFFKARVNTHYICNDCIKRASFYGIGHNPSDYIKQKDFINKYYESLDTIENIIKNDTQFQQNITRFDIVKVIDEIIKSHNPDIF